MRAVSRLLPAERYPRCFVISVIRKAFDKGGWCLSVALRSAVIDDVNDYILSVERIDSFDVVDLETGGQRPFHPICLGPGGC